LVKITEGAALPFTFLIGRLAEMPMDRRDFLLSSSLLAAMGLAAPVATGATTDAGAKVLPVLLPALPPLDHKGGTDIRVRVRSAMTGGVYSCVECAVAPKHMGPAPHAHRELDELMFVLEGTASVLIGDEVVKVDAGGWHLRPRLIKHTFWNAEDRPLRFIDMYFNQPFEEYLEATFHQFTPEKGYPEGSEEKRRAMAALTEKFGLIRFPDSQAQRKSLMARYGLM
jgi:mannose-6-phosphate isomerase-like protein (cupin superfamily)